jgi:hypothetical protein
MHPKHGHCLRTDENYPYAFSKLLHYFLTAYRSQ